MVGNSTLAAEKLQTLKSFDTNGQDLDQTRQILKKAIAKKPGTADAENFLKKLDEVEHSDDSVSIPVQTE